MTDTTRVGCAFVAGLAGVACGTLLACGAQPWPRSVSEPVLHGAEVPRVVLELGWDENAECWRELMLDEHDRDGR